MGYLIGFCIIAAIIVFIVQNPIVWIALAVIAALLLFLVIFYWRKNKSYARQTKIEENKRVDTIGHAADVSPTISLSYENQKSLKNPESKHSLVKIKAYHQTTLQQVRMFQNYVVIDTETTGLDRSLDKIVEIAVAIVNEGKIVDEYSTLVNPQMHISSSATAVNHISDDDVKNAPVISDILPKIHDMIKGKIVVGYNVSFDLAFLSRALTESGYNCEILYADVMSTVKRAVQLPNYKLETVARYYGVFDAQSHRALDDVRATNAVLRNSIDLIINQHNEELQKRRKERAAADAMRREKYKLSPLLDKTFVFTGYFELERESIEKMVETVGAILRDRVSGKTDYIVVGDTSDYPDWALARKLGKADELISLGKPIKKISEEEYIKMIYSAQKCINDK